MTTETTTRTTRVTICGPNLPGDASGTFHVHKEGCADLTRSPLYRRIEPPWSMVAASERQVVEEVYSDIIDENPDYGWTRYHNDFKFFPCVEGLPLEADEDQLDEREQADADRQQAAADHDDDPCPCGVSHTRAEHGYDPDDEDQDTDDVGESTLKEDGRLADVVTLISIRTEQDLASAIAELVANDANEAGSFDGADVMTFGDAGLMTGNEGVVIGLPNGAEFQITIVQSAEPDEDES